MISEIDPNFGAVETDEFIPPIGSLTTLGGGMAIAIFSVGVSLAATLSYNVTVKAPANIRPSGELRVVQAATEGTITSINVQENQAVKKGEPIAEIDNSQLQTKKQQLQTNIQQSHLQLVQITAQLNSLDRQIAAETNLMQRSVAATAAELMLQRREYQTKEIATIAEVQAAQAALGLAQEEKQRYLQLANTGAIAQLQVKEKEQAFKAAKAKLKQAEASLNPSNATVIIANEQIAQAKARGLATVAALNRERENLIVNKIALQNQQERDTKELQQTGLELRKTFILAPTDGTILKLELRNSGQVVGMGDAIAQIAPRDASLVVKARVAEPDISKVKPGQQVQMRVSACPYPDYGTLRGVVQAVAPDAIPAASAGLGAIAPSIYEVTIQPDNEFVSTGDRVCRLQPGMEGAADIISRSETVLQFILRKARLLTDL
ncbi:MAG: Hemolysin secretion protein D, chromosomal [Chroococcidiopsis cubana SAG 39.79]|jgi:HlyD family type I secretion membrane fusion protein|uniref:Secretion protein HlyD n=2 Tax=Chroococcidiopsis TaxID=54298 RepID=A0AB37UCR4_9CYAN|nr:HlyD family efflux transporter periplasmic adaptor subunit [Chroococcidiopsis cubana]MDZ4871374.1 Hemolysin secretion protein D, chromosomal [Chroococcidiopsis cubana SAG 39.79]RUT04919.1 secretion protein HlyD [Chroococcidiopsis cubana SAG 39.79]